MIWIRGTEPRRRGGECGLVVSSQWVSDWGHVAWGTMPSIGTRPRRHSRGRRVVIRDGRRNLARGKKYPIALTVPVFIPPNR